MSNAYFSRPFFIQELLWAREAGVPIQPVIRVSDKQRIGNFLGAAPADLKSSATPTLSHLIAPTVIAGRPGSKRSSRQPSERLPASERRWCTQLSNLCKQMMMGVKLDWPGLPAVGPKQFDRVSTAAPFDHHAPVTLSIRAGGCRSAPHGRRHRGGSCRHSGSQLSCRSKPSSVSPSASRGSASAPGLAAWSATRWRSKSR